MIIDGPSRIHCRYCRYCFNRLYAFSGQDFGEAYSNGVFIDAQPKQAVDKWGHKYFKFDDSHTFYIIPFSNVCYIDRVKTGEGNLTLYLNWDLQSEGYFKVPLDASSGQLEAYLEWVDEVNK